MLSHRERMLALACGAMAAVAVFGPAVADPGAAQVFVDHRAWEAVPNAGDVLSNLAFLAAGLAGLWQLARVPLRAIDAMERAMAALFFVGLMLTAGASAWYHWVPEAAGLAIDRTGMSVAFAGLLGLAAGTRVSGRAAAALGLTALLLGPFAARAALDGNVVPWALVQFGGAALLAWMACLRPRASALTVGWFGVLVAYILAKLFEANDAHVFAISGELVSGHTLKHVVAALAALPVISALGAARERRQNGRLRTKASTHRPLGQA